MTSTSSTMSDSKAQMISFLKKNGSEISSHFDENGKHQSLVDNPLFKNKTNYNIGELPTSAEQSALISSFCTKHNIPQELKYVYELVAHTGGELSIGSWQFLSIQKSDEMSNGKLHMLDIAIQYAGMGHIEVLTMDKDTKEFFVRADGGSNGFEREDYFEKYKTMKPSESGDYEMMTFTQALHMMIEL